jgi:hypothetical protein
MRFFLLYSALFLLGCNTKVKTQSPLFQEGKALGQVSERLHEASGLVASIANPNYFWTLNDSGNPAEVFLIDQNAQIRLVCKLDSIINRDFEDIAIGAGPDKNKNYIYAADVGDNLELYKIKLIYRFEEPTLSSEKEIVIKSFDTLKIMLPDAIRDSETIMIDPRSHDLFLISKREDSVRLYQVRYPFQSDTLMAEKVAVLPFKRIVAGSFSTTSNEVIIKDYKKVYYWKNDKKLPLEKLLTTKPIESTYHQEPQGESICWAHDGSGYYTLSEKADGKLGKLLYYKRR